MTSLSRYVYTQNDRDGLSISVVRRTVVGRDDDDNASVGVVRLKARVENADVDEVVVQRTRQTAVVRRRRTRRDERPTLVIHIVVQLDGDDLQRSAAQIVSRLP